MSGSHIEFERLPASLISDNGNETRRPDKEKKTRDSDKEKKTRYLDKEEEEYYSDLDNGAFDDSQPNDYVKKEFYALNKRPIIGRGHDYSVISARFKNPYDQSMLGVALKILLREPSDNTQGTPSNKRRWGGWIRRKGDRTRERKAEEEQSQAREQRRLRIRREMHILSLTDHLNIVRFYDYFESRKNFYLSTELLRGPDLRSVMDNKGKMPEDGVMEIARSILAGIRHLHSKQIVHGYIMPENVRWRGNRKTTESVIIGFRYARKLDENIGMTRPESDNSLTDGVSLPENTRYLAPEILAQPTDKGNWQKPCDIWSFGMVLYEMLTGKHASERKHKEMNAPKYDPVVMFNQRRKRWSGVSNHLRKTTKQLLRLGPEERLNADDANSELFDKVSSKSEHRLKKPKKRSTEDERDKGKGAERRGRRKKRRASTPGPGLATPVSSRGVSPTPSGSTLRGLDWSGYLNQSLDNIVSNRNTSR